MGALEAVHDAVPVARWPREARRAEMARLALELRSLQVEPVRRAPCAESIIPMVETMLMAAMQRLDAEATAASLDSEGRVSCAMRQAADRPVSVGADPTLIHQAADLSLEGSPTHMRAHLKADSEPGPDAIPLDPWHDLHGAAPEPDLDVLGPVVDIRDPAQVYAAFWGDVHVERPVRQLFRRWVQGEAS